MMQARSTRYTAGATVAGKGVADGGHHQFIPLLQQLH